MLIIFFQTYLLNCYVYIHIKSIEIVRNLKLDFFTKTKTNQKKKTYPKEVKSNTFKTKNILIYFIIFILKNRKYLLYSKLSV